MLQLEMYNLKIITYLNTLLRLVQRYVYKVIFYNIFVNKLVDDQTYGIETLVNFFYFYYVYQY